MASSCSSISNLQQSKTMDAIQMRVAKKALDVQKFEGDAAVKLIQAASQTGPGDALVAAASGLGGAVDTYG